MLKIPEKRTLCVSTGKDRLQLVELSLRKDGVHVHNSVILSPVPPSSTELSVQLRQLLQAKHIKTKTAYVVSRSEKMRFQRVTVPFMGKRELKIAAHQAASEHQSIPAQKLYIDYRVLRDFIEGGIKRYELLIASCPQVEVDTLEDALLRAHLKPRLISALSGNFAFQPQFRKKKEIKIKEVHAYVYLSPQYAIMAFLENGVYVFSRKFATKTTNLPPSLLNDYFPEPPPPIDDALKERDDAFTVPSTTPLEGEEFSRIMIEISRSLRHFQQNFRIYRVTQLILCGQPLDVTAVRKALQQPQIQVSSYDKLVSIHFPDLLAPDAAYKASYYAGEVSLMFGNRLDEKLNFIPSPSWIYRFRGVLAITTCLLTLLCGVLAWQWTEETLDLRHQVSQMQAEKARVQAQLTQLQKGESTRQNHQNLRRLVTREIFEKERVSTLPFKQLTHIIPKQIQLESIATQALENTWEGSLTGKVTDTHIELVKQHYDEFYESIQTSPFFKNAEAPTPKVAIDPAAQNITLNFEIDFQLTPRLGPSESE